MFISEKVTRGGEPHILGGNMKTRVAVYEEGLFDLRGGKTFLGGEGGANPHPPKETLYVYMFRANTYHLPQYLINGCRLL